MSSQCQETRPSCANCERKQLACIYRKPDKEGPQLIVKQPTNGPQWSSSSQFSLTDMQFFHHYLVNAANVIPSDRTETWTMDLPRIAHQVGVVPETPRRTPDSLSSIVSSRFRIADCSSIHSSCMVSYPLVVRIYQILDPPEIVQPRLSTA